MDGRGLLWFLQLPGSSNSLHRFEDSRQLGSANLLLVTGPEGTCSGSVMVCEEYECALVPVNNLTGIRW